MAAVVDHLRREYSDAIDVAHRVDIIASLGELGRQAIPFPHAVEPLRWTFEPASHVIRLVDETSHEEPPAITAYDLLAPVKGRGLKPEKALGGITIRPPGMLLVARYMKKACAVFASVPPQNTIRSLTDLRLEQDLRIAKPDAEAVSVLLKGFARWSRARAVGSQAILRKEMTLGALRQEIVVRACGRDFATALKSGAPYTRAQALVGGSPGFGARMRTFTHHEAHSATLAALSASALSYHVVMDSGECVDAYELVFAPLSFQRGRGVADIERIAKTLRNQPLIRGAFLARAASAGEPHLDKAAIG